MRQTLFPIFALVAIRYNLDRVSNSQDEFAAATKHMLEFLEDNDDIIEKSTGILAEGKQNTAYFLFMISLSSL